ncbi:hypothetical protein [Oceanobacillus arenosus]|nr:hypothetical protein [Oceanobacillus arenosus]
MSSLIEMYGSEKAWDVAADYAACFEKLSILYDDEHGIYVDAGVDIQQGK